MTAVEIIEEIQQLPPAEKERVIGFVRSLEKPRKMSPDELNALARKLVEARSDGEAQTIKQQITAGFYGE